MASGRPYLRGDRCGDQNREFRGDRAELKGSDRPNYPSKITESP
ncbi:hypothetical protein [Oscillatoria sp. HE19RPO]|nr:hypothetical protein [Oscillatoria sp. HE19RPO]